MTVTLRQIHGTPQRLDCRGLLPGRLAGMSSEDIRHLPLRAGNRRIPLEQLFTVGVVEDGQSTLHVYVTDGNIDFLGAGLEAGHMVVHGDAGDLAGRGMSGGRLTVHGNCGDAAGSGFGGGTLVIEGNSGDGLGSPAAGERQGQRGGVIHVFGNAGDRAGERMRRGVLMIEGDAGRLLGHRMIAGTVFVGGRVAERAGYGMSRGTLLLRKSPDSICSTMRANGYHTLGFLPLLFNDLQQVAARKLDLPTSPSPVTRYLGDVAVDGRGELLILN